MRLYSVYNIVTLLTTHIAYTRPLSVFNLYRLSPFRSLFVSPAFSASSHHPSLSLSNHHTHLTHICFSLSLSLSVPPRGTRTFRSRTLLNRTLLSIAQRITLWQMDEHPGAAAVAAAVGGASVDPSEPLYAQVNRDQKRQHQQQRGAGPAQPAQQQQQQLLRGAPPPDVGA